MSTSMRRPDGAAAIKLASFALENQFVSAFGDITCRRLSAKDLPNVVVLNDGSTTRSVKRDSQPWFIPVLEKLKAKSFKPLWLLRRSRIQQKAGLLIGVEKIQAHRCVDSGDKCAQGGYSGC
eukprot:4338167-Amphidinium_carterae.2